MAGYIGSKASVVSSGAERKKTFAITTSTTSLTGLSYTPTKAHVFHNGVRLVDGTDYTATDGTSITLNSAAENGDEVVVISYAGFQVADAYTQAEADAEFVAKAGGTMTGGLTGTDLTLSGGVYLGGTGSANKLDDYEEGTWAGTATITSATSSYITDETYTKIGQIVHVSFTVNFSGASGVLTVSGLPFASIGRGVGIGREDASSGYAIFARIGDGDTFLSVWDTQGVGNPSPFNVSAGNFRISLTYRTTS